MTTVAISNWATDILPKVPGVPWPGIISAVRDAAEDFCKQTLLHSVWLDRISIIPSTPEYQLTLPAGCTHLRLWNIDQLFFKENGADDDQFVPIDPASEQEIERVYGTSWRFATGPSPTEFICPEYKPTYVRFRPIPTLASTNGILIRANVVPIETATTLEDWLYYRWNSEIAAGALSDLYSHKAAPYYDPQLASAWGMVFRDGVANAKIKKISGRTKRPTATNFNNAVIL
jgi:hypothetical protein